ncbi:MAG: HPP family protein [Hyphomicrobiaceae bacterium]
MRRQVLIAIYRALGAGIAIGVMEILAYVAREPMVRVPFVTSIVLAMALPDSEPAQPRAIIGGHLLSCLAGYIALIAVHAGEGASAIAVGLSTLLMIASRTLHPPAGIDAFMVASYGLPWDWVLNPVLIGALLLSGFGLGWRALERRLFFPADRKAAPQFWSIERIRALTPPWRARH